jgi:DtxR family Mn-dependent transcriptional regulator
MEGQRELKETELPLTALKDGESGIITSIKTGQGRGLGGSWGFKRRLMDMGLTPRTKVTVVKSAPFHGPLEILVRGSRLVIGRGMAEKIFVEIEKE